MRNPAAYLKISDLATPAGIDHDYNYLTSIEREFDKAESQLESNGLRLENDTKHSRQPLKGEVHLRNGLDKARVTVTKAPKGMSRNKTNTTRWSKPFQCLEWTVEWVHPDGARELGQCREDSSIQALYEALLKVRNYRSTKRKGGYTHRGTKKIAKEHEAHNLATPSAAAGEGTSRQATGFGEDASGLEIPKPSALKPDDNCSGEHISSPPAPTTMAFYLHTPSLPSRNQVLAALSPDATLSNSLQDRLVLEYPTIHVFNQSADDSLPDGFTTEEEYFKTSRKERIAEIEEGEIVKDETRIRMEESKFDQVDEKKLIEVLGKDVRCD